jgi:intracellular septation protein
MDKRFWIELLPGLAFLAGAWAGGLFLGAGLAALATGVAIVLRWRWDRRLPWLALAILALTVVLLAAGLAFDEDTWIKVSGTVGSLAFACMVAAGALLRPSLLRRTLGYRLSLTDRGWRALHRAWIGVSLLRAAANEAVWRTSSDAVWAAYNGLSDIAWIGAFFAATWLVAARHWDDAPPPGAVPPAGADG